MVGKEQRRDPNRWRAASIALVLGLAALAAFAHHHLRQGRGALAADLAAGGIKAGLTFDCQAGIENWERGWSEVKKEWCCAYQKLGCAGNPVDYTGKDPFDCSEKTGSSEFEWSVPKKMWCCRNKERGCPQVHHVIMTFLVAEVNYAALKETEFIKSELLQAVKTTIVDVVPGHHVSTRNITLTYWAGSGTRATTPDLANTGVVIRATISVPAAGSVDEVRASVGSATFRTMMTSRTGAIHGIHAVCFGSPEANDVMVEMAIVEACTCDGGVPAEGSVCPKTGGNACGSCNAGYHLTTAHACVENACHCEGGIASQGELCETHMSLTCASCLLGHHYNTTSQGCPANACTCPMGFPAAGSACTMHLGEICSSCYPGYHVDLETKQCQASMCSCPNGQPVNAKDCPRDGSVSCRSCADGFHLGAEGACAQNACHCENGTPALGDLCHAEGKEVCAFCREGFFLHSDGRCGNKECICNNGTAAEGNGCTTNGATICASCDRGFTLHASGQCLEDKCHCKHGLALDPDACEVPGQSSCASCFEGYQLEGRECVANRCKCANGEPSVGERCPVPYMQSCASCKEGYNHRLEPVQGRDAELLVPLCFPNACTCTDNGKADGERIGEAATAHSDPPCRNDGENHCLSCLRGHHREGDMCVENVCLCEGGIPVPEEQCSHHGATNCTACHEGHWIAEDLHWQAEPGYKKPRESKFKDGAKICIPDSATTAVPFDCLAAFDNWEEAWSDSKKEWCCENEDRGCVAESTGRDLCEGQGFDFQQCALVGCCRFDMASMECKSAVADEACYPQFHIRSVDGSCVGAERDETGLDKMVGKLMSCNHKDLRQFWRPDVSKQIGSPTGFCLEVAQRQVGSHLSVARCASTVPPPESQQLVWSGRQIKVGSSELCLSADTEVSELISVAVCDDADRTQAWDVPEVQGAA